MPAFLSRRRAWLSALDAGFLTFRLQLFLPNLRKRLIKTPKLYFYDSGLLWFLLGIREPEQLLHHPMRGAVFESWVASELLKAHYHRGASPSLYFFQDRRGHEIDFSLDRGTRITAAEAKSAATAVGAFLDPATAFGALLAESAPELAVDGALVYGGVLPSFRGAVSMSGRAG